MEKSFIEPLPFGSRWELFIETHILENYLMEISLKPFIREKNKNYEYIINKSNTDYIYSALIYKNTKLTTAYPFFFDTNCKKSVEINNIQYTGSGDAFITFNTQGKKLTAFSIDFSLNEKQYKKNSKLFFTAISYSFSKINLLTTKIRELIRLPDFLPDEYTLTAKVVKDTHPVFYLNLNEYKLENFPVYAGSIYLKKPGKGDIGAGDIWIMCFTEKFAEKMMR